LCESIDTVFGGFVGKGCHRLKKRRNLAGKFDVFANTFEGKSQKCVEGIFSNKFFDFEEFFDWFAVAKGEEAGHGFAVAESISLKRNEKKKKTAATKKHEQNCV
jgi:hypothetical protein